MPNRESSLELLGRLKLGREEYCQRLLTMLILGGPYPRWNTRSQPSDAGLAFLHALDALSFGAAVDERPTAFVDELELPRRNDEESGGAPDYGVLWERRLWLIELKTDVGSHRPTQIPTYFELGSHHHPESHVDVTYLTPPMSTGNFDLQVHQRFAHVTWAQVVTLIERTWSDSGSWEHDLVDGLIQALDSIPGAWTDWRRQRLDVDVPANAVLYDVAKDPLDDAFALALATAGDGQQRALDLDEGSLEQLQELRLALRQKICAGRNGNSLQHVRPWLWDRTSSGGSPLTPSGQSTGYELRVSRYKSPVC